MIYKKYIKSKLIGKNKKTREKTRKQERNGRFASV